MENTPQFFLLLSIVLGIFIGWGCSYLAQQRGRDPWIWFIIGFFLGLLGLVLLMILPNVKVNEEKMTVSDQGQCADMKKLNGIEPEKEEWYFLDDEGVQSGPVTLSSLRQLFEDKKISSISYVWSEGMEEWKTIEECNLFTS